MTQHCERCGAEFDDSTPHPHVETIVCDACYAIMLDTAARDYDVGIVEPEPDDDTDKDVTQPH